MSAHLDRSGWVADFPEVAKVAFPDDEQDALRAAGTALLSAPDSSRFRKLPLHGPGFTALLGKLASAAPPDCLDHLLDFHRAVQASRRGGGAWLRREHGKLLMQNAGYNGHGAEPTFPTFELNVVRQLLFDLGRIE